MHIDDPYAESKVGLLSVVAGANHGRVIWTEWAGFATVLGFPVDLQLIDVLFTSLLVQAGRAAVDASASSSRSRTPAFRRAFLSSYAQRIGERLAHARADEEEKFVGEHGNALVPVLARRAEAVDEAVREAFPSTEPMRRRALDAEGWHAGRTAADLAVLGNGQSRLEGV